MASEPVRTTIDPTLAAVFTNPAVLKVGYRFDGDMRLLRSSFPAMTCFTEMKSYLELANVQGHLFEIGFHGTFDVGARFRFNFYFSPTQNFVQDQSH